MISTILYLSTNWQISPKQWLLRAQTSESIGGTSSGIEKRGFDSPSLVLLEPGQLEGKSGRPKEAGINLESTISFRTVAIRDPELYPANLLSATRVFRCHLTERRYQSPPRGSADEFLRGAQTRVMYCQLWSVNSTSKDYIDL